MSESRMKRRTIVKGVAVAAATPLLLSIEQTLGLTQGAEAGAWNCVDEIKADPWWGPHYNEAFIGPNFAGQFAVAAANRGWTVDGKPEVGDVVVFQGGVHESVTTGHVAIVIAVNGGTIDIRERNPNPPGSIRRGLRVTTTAVTNQGVTLPGMAFVHRRKGSSPSPAPPSQRPAPPPPPTPRPAPAPARREIIVDDRSGDFRRTRGGTWREALVGYGNHSYWTYAGTSVDDVGEWSVNLSGHYDVYAYIPRANASAQARYEVFYLGGTYTKVVDQNAFGNPGREWAYLGAFNFAPGYAVRVRLTDNTGQRAPKMVSWDAIKFVPR